MLNQKTLTKKTKGILQFFILQLFICLVLIVFSVGVILVESHWKEDGAGNEKLIQLLTPWGTLTKFICFPSSQIIHLERRDDNICFTYLGVF